MTGSRRKRVQRLKKGIVLMGGFLLVLSVSICAAMMFQTRNLNEKVEDLTAKVESLADEVQTQRETAQEMLAQMNRMQETVYEGQRESEAEMQPGETAKSPVEEQQEDGTAVHKVYLTFDDGPSSHTKEILDILDRYDVKATFFVVGKEGDWAEEALVDIVSRGHTLGMHSYTHKYRELYQSVEAFAEDFVKLRSYLEDVTGVTSSVYRFPGGSSNTVSDLDMEEFADYLDSWDVRFFDWNVSSGDGGRQLLTVDQLVENSLEGIEERETSVILLHDAAGKTTTVEALPQIIESILAMDDTVILPITDDTQPVQHIQRKN